MSLSQADFDALTVRVDALADQASTISDISFGEDTMWLLVTTTLVFFMQVSSRHTTLILTHSYTLTPLIHTNEVSQ
jgi:hypothetical protein